MATRYRKVRKMRSHTKKLKRNMKTKRRKCLRCSKRVRSLKKHKMRGG